MLRVDYRPPGPVADAFFWSNSFVSGIRGPIGSGKSTACVFRPWRHIAESEPGQDGIRYARWAVIRNTYPELKTTTIKTWHQWFPPEIGRWQEQGPPTHHIRESGYDMEVMFIALDRPDDVRKLLSLELTGAWINEAREVPKAILDGLTGRVGRFPAKAKGQTGWSGVILDTNSPDTDHWWYRLAEEEKPDGFAFFSQPGGDDPRAENRENLPDNYYERTRAGKSDDWIKVYIKGEYGFVRDGRPVFPEYRDAIHCRACEPLKGLPLVLGMDFGLTPAVIIMQRAVTGQWRALSEIVAEDMGVARFAEQVKAKLALEYPGFEITPIWGDPAGDQRAQTDETTPFEILRANGLPGRPAPSNDFVLRREAVAGALNRLVDGSPGLTVDPKCRVLRKALMGGYCYRRVQLAGQERYHDKPDKGPYSHVADALQYALLGGGEGKVVVRQFNLHRPARAISDYQMLG